MVVTNQRMQFNGYIWSGTMTKIASFLRNINKYSAWEEKCCLLISNISFRSRDNQVFKICKLANLWRHTLNQILIKYYEKRYLSQFLSKVFDSLQEDSTECATQYELNSCVTMVTYWVADFPNIKGFSGHLWCSILIFVNGASYAWFSEHVIC